jgi:uracil-DNA glycosylase family 4
MTSDPDRQTLADIAAQLKAYGDYFQAAGLEEAGPVSSPRTVDVPNVQAMGGIGGTRGMGASEDAVMIPHGPPIQKPSPPELSERSVRAEQTRAENFNSPKSGVLGSAMPPHPNPIVHAPLASTKLTADPAAELKVLRDDLGECTRCRLHEGRTHLVFGTGNPQARLMFVGEAPGQDEDEQGLPFVGRAGQLLTKMIEAMGLRRDDVYIANVLKCRPPGNRPPKPDEVATCGPFLRKQIAAIKPEVLCTLGSFAAQAVLRQEDKISAMRGKFFSIDGVTVMPTYHPAYLLRNPAEKRTVWEDLQKIMAVLKKAEGR